MSTNATLAAWLRNFSTDDYMDDISDTLRLIADRLEAADDLAAPITDDEIRAALVNYAASFQHDALAVVRALRDAGVGVVRAEALARYRKAGDDDEDKPDWRALADEADDIFATAPPDWRNQHRVDEWQARYRKARGR